MWCSLGIRHQLLADPKVQLVVSDMCYAGVIDVLQLAEARRLVVAPSSRSCSASEVGGTNSTTTAPYGVTAGCGDGGTGDCLVGVAEFTNVSTAGDSVVAL